MSTLPPKSDKLRKAIRWISDARLADPAARLAPLVGDAARRFDLSPLEEDTLFRTIKAEVDALRQGEGRGATEADGPVPGEDHDGRQE